MVKQVVKRSGEIESYDRTKISNAINKAFCAATKGRSQEENAALVAEIADKVEDLIGDGAPQDARHKH